MTNEARLQMLIQMASTTKSTLELAVSHLATLEIMIKDVAEQGKTEVVAKPQEAAKAAEPEPARAVEPEPTKADPSNEVPRFLRRPAVATSRVTPEPEPEPEPEPVYGPMNFDMPEAEEIQFEGDVGDEYSPEVPEYDVRRNHNSNMVFLNCLREGAIKEDSFAIGFNKKSGLFWIGRQSVIIDHKSGLRVNLQCRSFDQMVRYIEAKSERELQVTVKRKLIRKLGIALEHAGAIPMSEDTRTWHELSQAHPTPPRPPHTYSTERGF